MSGLKTTAENRDRFIAWMRDPTADRSSIRAWATAEDACHDVNTLLAENAKLRAVAEAARIVSRQFGDDYEARLAPLDAALAALEAP